MLPNFLLSPRPHRGCPLCVGSKNNAPSPSPFPFSHPWAGSWVAGLPMVRKGEGGRGWGNVFLFAQNSLFRIATYPIFSVLVIYWVPDCCAYQIDKKMTECCPILLSPRPDKRNQTQSNQKKTTKTKSDITHQETNSHNSCVTGYWVEQQICWRSDFFK